MKHHLATIVRVIEAFRGTDTKLELNQMLIFFLVAEKGEMDMSEIGLLTGLGRSAVSRNVLALSERDYKTDEAGNPLPGRDLVSTIDSKHHHKGKAVILTFNGRSLAQRISNIMERVENGAVERQ